MDPVRRRVFALTYVAYALYYLTRLNFSVALPSISGELGYSRFTLGLIGGAFSVSYAVGQFVNGQLVDSFGAKKIASLGLLLSAVMTILFGYADLFMLFLVIWAINGYAQSMGWPSVVKIISNWFRSSLGTVGGAFGSCFLVGNMIAWPLLGYIAANFGWRTAFLAPLMLVVLTAIIFYLGVDEKPGNSKEPERTDNRARTRFKRILLSKRILSISLAYTLLQFIRSGFTLWAPSFISETYGLPPDAAGYTAAMIPMGGIVGSAAFGWLSDRARRFGRLHVMFILLVSLSLVLLAFYNAAFYGLYLGMVLLFLSGLTLYSPHIMMTTVIPIEHEETHGAAGVAGFIDGVGYIGLTFADPFIGWIVDVYGWNGAVTFWIISSLSASLLIGLLGWNEIMKRRSARVAAE
jgi:sugar phosphate permease